MTTARLVHWPARDGTSIDDYWGALLDLKKEGKVRAVGLSNHNVAQLETAERIGHVDSLQPPFSAIRREFAADGGTAVVLRFGLFYGCSAWPKWLQWLQPLRPQPQQWAARRHGLARRLNARCMRRTAQCRSQTWCLLN